MIKEVCVVTVTSAKKKSSCVILSIRLDFSCVTRGWPYLELGLDVATFCRSPQKPKSLFSVQLKVNAKENGEVKTPSSLILSPPCPIIPIQTGCTLVQVRLQPSDHSSRANFFSSEVWMINFTMVLSWKILSNMFGVYPKKSWRRFCRLAGI